MEVVLDFLHKFSSCGEDIDMEDFEAIAAGELCRRARSSTIAGRQSGRSARLALRNGRGDIILAWRQP